MPLSIKTVTPLSHNRLQVHFRCGRTRLYDMNPILEMIDLYRFFLVEQKLFPQAKVSPDGQTVFWNEYVDIGCEQLWSEGKDVKSPFDGLLSCADAAALWDMDESTLRKAIADGRFVVGVDVMKFGKQWVVTLKAMKKRFGSLEQVFAKRRMSP